MSSNCKLTLEPTSEDTVQCLFFSTTLGLDTLAWEELCKNANNTIKTLSKAYIWQRDEFQVYIPITKNVDKDFPNHLSSITCFGENIEDEWFIVYLVLEISRQYSNLIIQITDNDGDFLLIEAADYLQTWANPENTENRVFIYNGHIHIIPPKVASLETKLDIEAAINIIHESPESTKVSDDIEQAILCRIGNYPEKILEHFHNAVVKLPSTLAALLILKPSFIAPIVNAYCNHDVIDAKCCKNLDFNDCVTINVKFTKFLYATLMHSKIINHAKQYTSGTDKKKILGLKLMCGYQMIINKASTDLFSSKEYHRFLDSLKQNGYFKNNIEGSHEYNLLLENAKEYFSIVESPISSSLSQSISQLMLSSEYIKIKESIKDQVTNTEDTGDKDEWLNINPGQLNELLLTRYGKTSRLNNTDVITSQNVTTELSAFLKQTSDFEGIESDRNKQSEDENIEFESDQFVSCIEKMLNILSTGEVQNEDSDDNYDSMEDSADGDDDCDKELKAKLQNNQAEDLQNSKTILANIVQSMKEEKASSGPTSNLLRTIGVHKSELLDSDDDID